MKRACALCNFPKDRLLGETTSYIVGVCVGPLVEGHVMVFPKKHGTGLIDLARDKLETLEEIKTALRVILSRDYGKVLFYEHGHHGDDSREMYHGHAHLHAVPTGVDISHLLDEEGWTPLYATYPQMLSIQGEYLFYEGPKETSRFYCIEKQLRTQLVRNITAHAIRMPIKQADWRHYPRYDLVERTKEKLGERVRQLCLDLAQK